ncbi:hypothetical protein AB0M23_28495 [Streptomyces sp. NPDC052077]|uniref:hypothetical protein n=1 Tax=Streptomyces sp. NPDC052077 TaxID=3154757 RepID=UPI0034369F31
MTAPGRKPPLPADVFGDWERIPVDDQAGSDFTEILRIGTFAADHWTLGPDGPHQRPRPPAAVAGSQIREALLHLLELGLIDIDTGRLHTAAGYPMQRSTRP